jgi:hypothetical protein
MLVDVNPSPNDQMCFRINPEFVVIGLKCLAIDCAVAAFELAVAAG